jgi:multidrug efflux pump subunit AcrA (membrane-fusion protein)
MSEKEIDENLIEPGRESLIYTRAKVSWAINSFIVENSSRVERMFLLSLIMFFVVFILWGVFTFKAIIVDTTGVFISTTPAFPVTAEKSFIVSKLLVKDGQHVHKGDTLFSEKGASFDNDISEVKTYIEKISQNLELLRTSTCDMKCVSHIKTLIESPVTSSPILLKDYELKNQIYSLESSLKPLSVRLDELSSLESSLTTFRTRMASTSKKIEEIERRKATKILNMEYEQLKNELADLNDQVKEKSNYVKLSLSSAVDTVDVILKKMPVTLDLFIERSDMLAPVSGKIAFEDLRGAGQVVNPGQILFRILPDINSIIAKLDVKNQEVARIKPGQIIKFEIEAYPSTDYGIQEGLVDYIPIKDPNDKDPNYKVMAKLVNQKIVKDGKSYDISPGMKTKAKILIKNERTILFFLNKIFKIKNELLGD